MLNAHEAMGRGRAVRATVPRSQLANLGVRPVSFDLVTILRDSDLGRIKELIPLRYGRMLHSPLDFLRGAVVLQANDFCAETSTTIDVQLCGDALLTNFGLYDSAEGRSVFDINDFDETTSGPFEWDVKRFVSSVVVAARGSNINERQQDAVAEQAAATYRRSMAKFANETASSIWNARIDVGDNFSELRRYFTDDSGEKISDVITDIKSSSDAKSYLKVIKQTSTGPQIANSPPLLVPLNYLENTTTSASLRIALRHLMSSYLQTLSAERQLMLSQFVAVDAARKVVGIGSVGRHCYVVLLAGRNTNDLLLIQLKEQTQSAFDVARQRVSDLSPGERVIRGQRIMQATPDMLVGWCESSEIEGGLKQFSVRQLFDNKSSVDVTKLDASTLISYVKLCAWVLARSHARSGKALEIKGYLGESAKFDEAIAAYSVAFAKRNEHDFEQLKLAAKSRHITVAEG